MYYGQGNNAHNWTTNNYRTEKHLMNVLHKYLENFQTFPLVFTSEPVQ